MNILIVKHGALGDVVRTSYFAGALRRKWGPGLRLSWITAPSSLPLLRFHPQIDDLFTSFAEANAFEYDRIYSLDDERDILDGVAQLRTGVVTGAFLRDGVTGYSEDSACWFDMGLLSRFGKTRADELKKLNQRGHAEIFSEIFEVQEVTAEFHGNPRLEHWAEDEFEGRGRLVGINPFAGGRWPSKELRLEELRALIEAILSGETPFGRGCCAVLVGAGPDRHRNLELAAALATARIVVPDTDDSILRLAAVIRSLDVMITSDSLAMHLAISQRVPTLAFFAPTSAPEIDSFGVAAKLTSTASDYCSYRKDADNASITGRRLLEQAGSLRLASGVARSGRRQVAEKE